jgi:mannose/fructose/N-acetylgalactosamine-specific phosphotransferase system component IIC
MVLVALIFAIIAVILHIAVISSAGYKYAVAFEQGITSPVASIAVGVAGFLLLVFLIIDVLVIRRISNMYLAAKNGDIAALKSLNSLGWAIVALIFTYIIPGVLLLIAYGMINDLPSPQA